MKNLKSLVLILMVMSCSIKKGSESKVIEQESVSTPEMRKEKEFINLVLFEDSIGGIKIPFESKKDLLLTLQSELNPFSVKRIIGQQDGPDFPLYTVQRGNEEIIMFSMNPEDTLKLDEIHIKSPLIKDMYGLSVGDDYSMIKSKRKGELKNYTDFHQHTYLYADGSNVIYEINGELNLPDDADFENLKLTEEQIKNWKIENIVWRKK